MSSASGNARKNPTQQVSEETIGRTSLQARYSRRYTVDAMMISASALVAQRTRMNLISSNLANALTTRTPDGGPYKRKDAVFGAMSAEKSFSSMLDRKTQPDAKGVQVMEIVEDRRPPKLQYEPSHPDANPQGYVAYPDVNAVEEMADMINATRSYEANVTASKAAMGMQMKAMEILSK
jgi:flagellar basal-body rod protein FlgC